MVTPTGGIGISRKCDLMAGTNKKAMIKNGGWRMEMAYIQTAKGGAMASRPRNFDHLVFALRPFAGKSGCLSGNAAGRGDFNDLNCKKGSKSNQIQPNQG